MGLPNCRLCGDEFTGRGEHGHDTHYNCRRSWEISLSTLAHNLAIGAMLAESFWLGYERRVHDESVGHGDPTDQDWRPGCGKAAPGWTRVPRRG